MRIIFFIFYCVLILCSSEVRANVNLAGTGYTITATTLTYNPEKSCIFLKESVRIVNEALTITAKEVDVLLEKGQDSLSFSSESIEELRFRSNVNFLYKKTVESQPVRGKSDSARYDVKKEMLYLYGNALVESDGSVVEGDEIHVNLLTNSVYVQGSNKKPVEILIRPKN